MYSLSLPSKEETLLEIHIPSLDDQPEQTLKIDILEIEDVHYRASTTRDKCDPGGDMYRYFLPEFLAAFGVKITKTMARMILETKIAINETLKKKYPLPSAPGITSDSDHETNESCSSSV